MDTCTRDDLRALAFRHDAPCLSLYFPTHSKGPEVHSSPARLRSMLAQAHRQLADRGLGNGDLQRYLKHISSAADDALFWRSSDAAVVFFVSPGQSQTFRLPVPVKEQIVVNHQFHIRPLLRAVGNDADYFILALSENQAKLFQGTRLTLQEIPIPGAPRNLADALRYDEAGKVSQVHSGGNSRSGKAPGVFHGQGDASDYLKENLSRYFRLVEKSLRPLLREKKTPLVLAGVDYHFAIYREINTYPYLAEKGIAGCPDRLRQEELRVKAWAVAESIFVSSRQKALRDFTRLVTQKLATDDLQEVLRGSYAGRTKALFLRGNDEIWGQYDALSDRITLSPEPDGKGEDLLNTAAAQSLVGGGVVYSLDTPEMPTDAPVAAVFRY